MSEYHEPAEELSDECRDFHRALASLKEEIEAVDWYHQRVSRCKDPSLKKILAHNRDEEVEHACMTLEWLRRNMPAWQENLSTYLFTETEVVHIEDDAGKGGESDRSGLSIGSLKSEVQE